MHRVTKLNYIGIVLPVQGLHSHEEVLQASLILAHRIVLPYKDGEAAGGMELPPLRQAQLYMSTVGKVRVIFVSKRNSLRSVLAHACLEHIGGDRHAVLSCGSPKYLASEIHPAALGALASARMRPPLGIPTSWEKLKEQGAARAAFIITLDDETMGEQPAWPGQPDTALWSMPDVAALEDPEKTAYGAIQALYALRRRLELFVNLPLAKGDRASLRADVRDLGTMR